MYFVSMNTDVGAVVCILFYPQEALFNIHLSDQGIVNLPDLVFQAPPENLVVKCRITRDKHGLDKHMYPIYYLHLEWEAGARVSGWKFRPR